MEAEDVTGLASDEDTLYAGAVPTGAVPVIEVMLY